LKAELGLVDETWANYCAAGGVRQGPGYSRGLAMDDLSREWRGLIRKLWEPAGKSIVGFLPGIVAEIKATKSAAMAERALLNVLHSPKVRDMPLRLLRRWKVLPGDQEMKLMADAARLPLGQVRKDPIAKINARSKHVALTVPQIMHELDAIPKEKLDTASAAARQARRAGKKLGISRGCGGIADWRGALAPVHFRSASPFTL
jgi:hypothetical protein